MDNQTVNNQLAEKAEKAPVALTPEAAVKVAEFIEQSGGGLLRIKVLGGGCSGFQYQLALDEKSSDDLTFLSEGQTILVSPETYPYVAGSCIKWVDDLMRMGFDVDNPHAVSACGCGSSFRIDEQKGCDDDDGQYYL